MASMRLRSKGVEVDRREPVAAGRAVERDVRVPRPPPPNLWEQAVSACAASSRAGRAARPAKPAAPAGPWYRRRIPAPAALAAAAAAVILCYFLFLSNGGDGGAPLRHPSPPHKHSPLDD